MADLIHPQSIRMYFFITPPTRPVDPTQDQDVTAFRALLL